MYINNTVTADVQLKNRPQLDARPTDDQGVTGSNPAGSAHSFVEIWSWNIFYDHSLSAADSTAFKWQRYSEQMLSL